VGECTFAEGRAEALYTHTLNTHSTRPQYGVDAHARSNTGRRGGKGSERKRESAEGSQHFAVSRYPHASNHCLYSLTLAGCTRCTFFRPDMLPAKADWRAGRGRCEFRREDDGWMMEEKRTRDV